MASLSLRALCILPFLFCHVAAIYMPLREHAGSTFFDRWAYYGNVDNTTWGNVTYQDQANATSKGLTFVNGAGHAIVKVDNTTTLLPGPLVNRDSIRLTSLDSYGIGSLIIIDAVHIPYGCSVWPSFWTYGIQEEWPLAGEIDIIEAINGMNNNQVALHTTPGCYQAQNPGQTGVTLEGDCSTDRGCIVSETKPNSYGPGFAAAGGGVYAVQIAASGIYSWFWSRPDIPDNVKLSTSTSTIDTAVWGLPSSSYPATACNITKYFPPQNLVLLTTLCGVWAGVPDIYRATCQTPTNSCVNDNIIGPGSTFDTAYWEIRYIRAYLADDAPPISSSSSAAPSSTTSDVPTTTTSTTTTDPITRPSSSAPIRFSHLTLSCFVLLSFMTVTLLP
ncbi:glycoside hydrolase family 16 protein [Hebeloma cylindrosporum]|uniref:Glycoside hydrolase family 16 protein n=1 Tax=Hebeloma cylindrosporum TaxID=76867 RepID=A0A0C3C3B3_HEBCY|nr:glycoside hydrolase family 16 protein [Hebeloma cylindrosporum h7]